MSTIPEPATRPEGEHRIWCGDTDHDLDDRCEISHGRGSARAVMTQRPGETEPSIAIAINSQQLTQLDVLQAQDVVMVLTLLLEHLARIGITAAWPAQTGVRAGTVTARQPARAPLSWLALCARECAPPPRV